MEKFKQIRLSSLSKKSKEEIQSLDPSLLAYNLIPTRIIEASDDFFLKLSLEQLNYVATEHLSYFPNEVLNKLIELYQAETDDVIISKTTYSEKDAYVTQNLKVKGVGKRLKQAKKIRKQRIEKQEELNELRKENIDEYEIDGYVPLVLVHAYIQDAMSPYYKDIVGLKELMQLSSIERADSPFSNKEYISKSGVIRYLEGRCTQNIHLHTIPKLTTIFSISMYHLDYATYKFKNILHMPKHKNLVPAFEIWWRTKYYFDEDVKIMLALSREN